MPFLFIYITSFFSSLIALVLSFPDDLVHHFRVHEHDLLKEWSNNDVIF